VSGTVVDGNHKPIRGATVSLYLDRKEVGGGDRTKDDGHFSVGGTHRPTRAPLSIVVSADAYDRVQQDVSPGENHKNVDVILTKSQFKAAK
jgi:hypothetical protein